ncbi:MAG TPA: hypothetical protein PLU70_06875 [Thermotogota bacterium]|nr:hypothetical protein [Thermotogota bacterium]HOM54834.1 hypothetical protein [Thermotogota bacterium]HOS24599.1 hypothetical protein [Thermotogota bacterium]HOT86562.1 hypothetical protein [Thermotogota bacterium]HPD36052.1 hypothetical protein [Thermotogota bacterium]
MKRIWIILLFLFSISLGFSLNYFLVPFDGYYWDVALSNMKPLFTPEEGVITKIIDPITFEISLRAPLPKTITVSSIGLSLSLFSDAEKSEAAEFVKRHLEGKAVALSYDWQGRDDNGVIPAYLWVPVIKPGKIFYVFWNLVMVTNGFATMSDTPFRTDYLPIFQDLYLYAMENKLGLLKSWDTEKPIGWDEIPQEYQNTLKSLFFREIEKKYARQPEDEWIFVKAFTGELYGEYDYYYSREVTRSEIEETTASGREYSYTTSVSRYLSKTYPIEIDTDQWRIEWKILPTYLYPSQRSFQIKITDNTDWSEIAAFVSYKVPEGEFVDGTKIINRRGRFELEVSGPNPYLIIISKKNPNY